VGHVLQVLTLNVGAAALARAEAILAWLDDQDTDVAILTETSAGAGTELILSSYRRAGWAVAHTPSSDGDRGVAVVSRVPVVRSLAPAFAAVSLPHRVTGFVLGTDPQLAIVGVYVPSRDRSLTKTEKKQTFITSLLGALHALPAELNGRLLVGGDYNVIGRDHHPAHPGFLPFEVAMLDQMHALSLVDAWTHIAPGQQAHSWIGRTGDGYRYDYLHLARPLLDRLGEVDYRHDTRQTRLSDHAALTLRLAVAGERLPVTDLAADALALF